MNLLDSDSVRGGTLIGSPMKSIVYLIRVFRKYHGRFLPTNRALWRNNEQLSFDTLVQKDESFPGAGQLEAALRGEKWGDTTG